MSRGSGGGGAGKRSVLITPPEKPASTRALQL